MDLGYYLVHEKYQEETSLRKHLVRLIMVLVLSPIAAIQGLLWAIDVVKVYSSEPDNPFRWYKIRLNLH